MGVRLCIALGLLMVACDGSIMLPTGSPPVTQKDPDLPNGNSIQAKCIDPSLIPQTVRLGRLTHTQYGNIVFDTLGVQAQTDSFAEDATSGGFSNNAASLSPNENLVKDWNRSAEALAAQIVASTTLLGQVAPCSGGQTQTCFNSFITKVGQ